MTRILLVLSVFTTSVAFASGIGISTYPMLPGKQLVSTEMTGIVSKHGGMGVQARYTRFLSKEAVADAGLGISGGERSSRIFAGLDYEIFPDYDRQPRVSIKATLENSKEFDQRVNIISFAPTASKGFNIYGEEVYPFAALPVAINLNSTRKTYETSMNLALGAASQLPIEGYRNLTASFEGRIDLKDSWSGVFLGLSYPMN